jgi:hypothetical protein
MRAGRSLVYEVYLTWHDTRLSWDTQLRKGNHTTCTAVGASQGGAMLEHGNRQSSQLQGHLGMCERQPP